MTYYGIKPVKTIDDMLLHPPSKAAIEHAKKEGKEYKDVIDIAKSDGEQAYQANKFIQDTIKKGKSLGYEVIGKTLDYLMYCVDAYTGDDEHRFWPS